MVELFDTASLMLSKSYKDRFKAEYWQLKVRYERLKRFVNKIEVAMMTSKEEPAHDCPYELLKMQEMTMCKYLLILEKRAVIEEVNLEKLDSEEN